MNIAKIIVGLENDCISYIKNCIKANLNQKQHKLVEQEQHPDVLLIRPSGENYLLDDLEILTDQVKYVRDQYFVVITKADFLTDHVANKLLKLIEEPPKNYFFFLCAVQAGLIIPTLRSRCVEILAETKNINLNLPSNLEQIFIDIIENKIDAYKITQIESTVTLEEIEKAVLTILKKYPNLYSRLKFYLENKPMPGSAKIALKSLCCALLNFNK
jgi:DNA polymerase III delta prime subunit